MKQRCIDTMATNVQVQKDNDERVYPNIENGFSNIVNWLDLTCREFPVHNPKNERFHAPSNHDVTEEIAMYNFSKTFDLPVFQEQSAEVELIQNGKKYNIDGEGKPKYYKRIKKKGKPKVEWLCLYNLTPKSSPID